MKLKPHQLTCGTPCKQPPCTDRVDAIDIFDAIIKGKESGVIRNPYRANVEEVTPDDAPQGRDV